MRNVLALLPLLVSVLALAGVKVDSPAVPPEKPRTFDARQSAALFVGVRDFAEQNLGEIRYTVDDAVDLAYTMAFEKKVALVPPSRVVVVISGQPVKPDSLQRLGALRRAGAVVIERADRATITAQLERQAKLAGRDGLLILFFASHGFTSDGVGYVLASDSSFHDTSSSLSTAKIFDLAATRPRSMVFVDACRERVPSGRRGPFYRAGGTAPMIGAMTPLQGQVIFYAAAPGAWAFEDPRKRNGVFTSAIIQALTGCDARKSGGMITAETLGHDLEEHVRGWIRRYKDTTVRKATQVLMDAQTKTMPMAFCGLVPVPAHLTTDGSSLTVSGYEGTKLWSATLDAPITLGRIVDLDDDQSPEVVVGDAVGTVTVFRADGERAWSEKAIEGMPIHSFTIDYLGAKKDRRHIVALSNAPDGGTSALTIFTSDGTVMAQHPRRGQLIDVVIDKVTARHAARIIAAGESNVFMLDRSGKPLWSSAPVPHGESIESLETNDVDNNRLRDIEVKTTAATIHLTFEGTTIRIAPK